MVINSCDSLTGWSLDTSSVGTKSIDTSIQTEGTGCIKYVRTVSKSRNTKSFLRAPTSVFPVDFSNKLLTFKYRWEGTPNNQLKVRILSGSTNVYDVNVDMDATNDVWIQANIVFTGTIASATELQIYNDGDQFTEWTDGTVTTLYLDDIQLNNLPPFTGVITNCESLNGWSLDTNAVGTGSIDHTLQTEGSGCIKYVRTVSKSRNFTENLSFNLPIILYPVNKALQFKYRWDTASNNLTTRFLSGNTAVGSQLISTDVAPNVWHSVTVPLVASGFVNGVQKLQFTNPGDQYSGWTDGQTVTLYLDDIRVVDIDTVLPASSAQTINDCDDLQLWSLDTNLLGTAVIDTAIKTQGAGSISYNRVVSKTRTGTVAATGNLTSNNVPPLDGDTVTIDTITYTFRDTFSDPTGSTAPYEVQIGGSALDTLNNLKLAMNDTLRYPDPGSGESVSYSIGTLQNLKVAANLVPVGSDPLYLPLSARTIGTSGNSLVTTSTSANLTFSTATLTGGGIGVKKLASIIRLPLPKTHYDSRVLVFDYMWSLPTNLLQVRFVNSNGAVVKSGPATFITISTNVAPNTWHSARVPLPGTNLSNLQYIDILHPGDLDYIVTSFQPFAGWNDGDSPTLHLDNLRMEALPRRVRRRPAVVIQFDDGYENNYTNALPIMQKYGQVATIGIATAYTGGFFVGNNRPCLSIAQIGYLKAAGWEICSHSVNHHNFRNLSTADTNAELLNSKTTLEGWGLGPIEHFIYPYTQNSIYSASVTGNYYSSSTIAAPPNHILRKGDTNSVYGNFNLQLLPRIGMGYQDTLENFIIQVNDAIKMDTLPIIYFHSIPTEPERNTVHVLADNFDKMMQYLSYAGIETLQTTDALRKFGYLND